MSLVRTAEIYHINFPQLTEDGGEGGLQYGRGRVVFQDDSALSLSQKLILTRLLISVTSTSWYPPLGADTNINDQRTHQKHQLLTAPFAI